MEPQSLYTRSWESGQKHRVKRRSSFPVAPIKAGSHLKDFSGERREDRTGKILAAKSLYGSLQASPALLWQGL
ncbi:hypothetical protein [Denitrobaculum tricleocarpae]|uniref:Uncharacterized protein n=1 Tax=Denitrobaculum tricleocarpae TaxID=2591009 RepID=A0A545TGF2_9PROT|nr:hypothetical protein [Denitrobaculum tricleocarpae]TQV76312.1 hypothetical protein FKG95_22035 [Denitrobaculum tricleocarpae]